MSDTQPVTGTEGRSAATPSVPSPSLSSPSVQTASGAAIPAQRGAAPVATVSPGSTGRRDQYIDGLRALALVRVLVYHTFGWIWLPVIFPSMGVMFALGGSLVATSLSRAPGRHWSVLRKRVRRLLPPLWLYGAVVVLLMARQGWTTTSELGEALTWRSALAWVVPFEPTPGSAWGDDLVLPLWYVRTYLWLLLLSPVMLWLFRRYTLATLAVPAVLMVALLAGVVDQNTSIGDTLQKLAIFATCWMLGFAHHDGLIARLAKRRTVLVALLVMVAGLGYAIARPQIDSGWNIDDNPLADALYSAGAVILLLRLYPRRTFLDRTPWLSRLVSAMNSRAMTIYLWGNLAIAAATPVLESNPWTLRLELDPRTGAAAQFAAAVLVLVVMVVAFGWAEDVAAGRSPRLNPWPRHRPAAPGRPSARRPPGAPSTASRWTGVRRNAGVLLVGLVLAASLVAAIHIGPGTAADSAAARRTYPVHVAVAASGFRIGAVVDGVAGDDGQSLRSSWDTHWAQHFGGCDGVGPTGRECTSDVAGRVGPFWFPTITVPAENPYYVGLPLNDLTLSAAARAAIPWAGDPGYAGRTDTPGFSLLKNRWVEVAGPAGSCFGQLEDSGPGREDPSYVLGQARPTAAQGIELSPAMVACLGIPAQGADPLVDWQFVDHPPQGPWTRIVTTRQVS